MTRGWVLVHDEGSGWGHERRMRALGKSLTSRGSSVTMLPLRRPVRSPGIVVDSYRARADDPAWFDGEAVVAFDDLGRDLAVDLVVDPSPGAEAGRHRSARAALAGARYAVVDPEIHAAGGRPPGGAVESVLVSFGAADSDGRAARVAAEIAGGIPGATIEVPVGPWWDGPVPAGVRGVRCPDGLAPRLARADLVVTGGGVTLLEALALGRPTVAVAIADNQSAAVEHAAARDAATACATPEAAQAAVALSADADRRTTLARNAVELIDGMGADRVAAEVLRLG